jgi:hypothetical protein
MSVSHSPLDLENALRRVVQGASLGGTLPFEIVFAHKETNSSSLQLADLVSHPIGRHHLKPAQPNRAYEVVEKKLWRNTAGSLEGYGIKVFP